MQSKDFNLNINPQMNPISWEPIKLGIVHPLIHFYLEDQAQSIAQSKCSISDEYIQNTYISHPV